MASVFVDTNVFLRFLTGDDAEKARRAESLFRHALKGKVHLTTSLLVIAEMIWTLESYYRLEKADVASTIEKILNTPNLECEAAANILLALDLYVHQNMDFVDAYHAFYMKDRDLDQILTYDRKHFSRVPWLHLREP